MKIQKNPESYEINDEFEGIIVEGQISIVDERRSINLVFKKEDQTIATAFVGNSEDEKITLGLQYSEGCTENIDKYALNLLAEARVAELS